MNISFTGVALSEVKFPSIRSVSPRRRRSCPLLFLLYKSREYGRDGFKEGWFQGKKKSRRRWNKSNFSRRQPARSSVVKSPIKLPRVFFLHCSRRGSAWRKDVLGQLGNEEENEVTAGEVEEGGRRGGARGDKGWRLGGSGVFFRLKH